MSTLAGKLRLQCSCCWHVLHCSRHAGNGGDREPEPVLAGQWTLDGHEEPVNAHLSVLAGIEFILGMHLLAHCLNLARHDVRTTLRSSSRIFSRCNLKRPSGPSVGPSMPRHRLILTLAWPYSGLKTEMIRSARPSSSSSSSRLHGGTSVSLTGSRPSRKHSSRTAQGCQTPIFSSPDVSGAVIEPERRPGQAVCQEVEAHPAPACRRFSATEARRGGWAPHGWRGGSERGRDDGDR